VAVAAAPGVAPGSARIKLDDSLAGWPPAGPDPAGVPGDDVLLANKPTNNVTFKNVMQTDLNTEHLT
jgi:hypothetical protein